MVYNYSNFFKCSWQINLTSVSVLCLFQLIVFYSPWHIFFCFSTCLIIFDWMPDSVNFNFLSAWYFYLPNNFELSPEMPFSFLGNNWILKILLLCITWWYLSSAQCKGNYSLRLRQDFSVYSAQCPSNYKSFQSSLWKPALCLALGHVRYCFL